MQRGTKSGYISHALWILGALAAIVGWAEFFYKPLQKRANFEDLSNSEVFLDLLKLTPEAYGWPFAGYIFLAASILLATITILAVMRPVRSVLNYLELSEVPISVLKSHIEFFIVDDKFEECRIKRTQYLHANQAHVDAYHHTFKPSHGTIEANDITIVSRINNGKITQRLMKLVTGGTVVIIERFSNSLPTSRLATYLPDKAVLYMFEHFKWFKRSVIVRESCSTDHNEYNGDFPYYAVTAARYPVSDITIELNFPEISAPNEEEIFAYMVSSQAVEDYDLAPCESPSGRKMFRVELNKLRHAETFRIQWENTNLKEHLENLAAKTA